MAFTPRQRTSVAGYWPSISVSVSVSVGVRTPWAWTALRSSAGPLTNGTASAASLAVPPPFPD